jgi:undecaprenyl-diphosphatase
MTPEVAALLGLVQGVFMFVPVSSSSHLALSQHWLGSAGVEVPPPDSAEAIMVNLVLHVGTLVSIGVVMRRRLASLVLDGRQELRERAWRGPASVPATGATRGPSPGAPTSLTTLRETPSAPALRFWAMVLLATVVTGVLGLGIRQVAPAALGDPRVIAVLLVLTGVVLWWTDRARQGTTEHPAPRHALAVGAAQALALLPGLSRSGLTIAAGIATGLTRRQAAELSFVLAIPTILAATAVQAVDVMALRGGLSVPWSSLAIGFTVAALSGTAALILVLRLLYAARFRVFSLYVWALAVVVLVTGVGG